MLALRSPEFSDYFNQADDVRVKLQEVPVREPPFKVMAGADAIFWYVPLLGSRSSKEPYFSSDPCAQTAQGNR